MPLTADERRALRRRCAIVVPGFAPQTAAQEFQQLADWCADHEVAHDHYGSGALAEGFEAKVAALLGKPAAVFMPSGIMAQLAALRVWCETTRTPRFGMHPTAHPALHEEQAFEALFGLHGVPLGHRLRPLQAADLQACRQPLACAIVELPIRESGGQLPTWDELQALQAAARERGIRLHMDGARLWESAPFYGRPHAEVCAGFDSVYVSVYKGIGALSGALLAGDADFIAQARLWRRRMGGTLYHLSPMIASAAMRFDERIALMPALYERAQQLAAGLQPLRATMRVNPAVPHTPLFHLFFHAPAEAVAEARDSVAQQHGAWLVDGIEEAEVPGWSRTEMNLGDRVLDIEPERLAALFEHLHALLLPHAQLPKDASTAP